MNDDDRIAPLLPWYANGTLPQDERAEVDRHLETCGMCRDLLVPLLAWVDEARYESSADARAHVHPELLVQYAESDPTLDDETLRWVEECLTRCATCREALERLREVERSLQRQPRPVGEEGSRASVWEWLTSTLLRPAPALAYLVLLLVVAPSVYLLRGPGAPTDAPAFGVRRVVVEGERLLRDRGGGTGEAPLTLALDPEAPEILLLELDLGLTVEEFEELRIDGAIEVLEGDRTLASIPVTADDFERRSGAIFAVVALQGRRFRSGGVYEIRLVVHRPGDPLDGQALFRRALAIRGP